jgi:regulatory protein
MDFAEKPKKYWSADEARLNIQRYCVYQDRCHKEVRTKLLEHGIYGNLLEEIISELIQENFLDEERFAKSYARGKFRMKQWGRNKIKQELKLRHVSDYCIKSALQEINEEEYIETLKSIITHKERLTKFKNEWDRKKKLSDYALSKGYEYELIISII